jgi:hypothetical protein
VKSGRCHFFSSSLSLRPISPRYFFPCRPHRIQRVSGDLIASTRGALKRAVSSIYSLAVPLPPGNVWHAPFSCWIPCLARSRLYSPLVRPRILPWLTDSYISNRFHARGFFERKGREVQRPKGATSASALDTCSVTAAMHLTVWPAVTSTHLGSVSLQSSSLSSAAEVKITLQTIVVAVSGKKQRRPLQSERKVSAPERMASARAC